MPVPPWQPVTATGGGGFTRYVGGPSGQSFVETAHPGPNFAAYGSGSQGASGPGLFMQSPRTSPGEFAQLESAPPGQFAAPVPAAPASQYARYAPAPLPQFPIVSAAPPIPTRPRPRIPRYNTLQFVLGIVLAVIGGIGCLGMVFMDFQLVVEITTRPHYYQLFGLVGEFAFLNFLALGTLVGGIMAIRSAKALDALLRATSGGTPQ